MNSPYPLDSLPATEAAGLLALRRKKIFFDGVFIGNYSLAIVNRNLVRTLLQAGLDVSCYTAEPDWRNDVALSKVPEVKARMLAAYPAKGGFDIHLRNTWPPQSADMIGGFNAYVGFAWEECDVPLDMIDRFNRDLDLLLVTATFVRDAFVHSGLTIPVETIGNGCDHISQIKPARRSPLPSNGRKRILHVSTCFPRKGVDRLIEAFSRSFKKTDSVELVIKTDPNPHNRVHEQMRAAKEAFPDAAPIQILEEALTTEQLAALYRSASLLVAPSRGEGFGLPLAEAMLHGVPVATTAYSGQVDFCTAKTCFPIDYVLVPSEAHVAGRYSLWADPKVESISRQMQEALDHPLEATVRTLRARRLIKRHLTWSKVADRVIKSLLMHSGERGHVSVQRSWTVDLASTWRQRCGIATYSEHLFGTEALRRRLATVYARKLTDLDTLPEGHQPWSRANPIEKRPWDQTVAGVHALGREISSATSDVFWFQHHPGQFSVEDMRLLATSLHNSAYRIRAITMHNVQELAQGDRLDWVKVFDVAFVHSAKDAAILSAAGHRNPVVVPHGIARSTLAEPRTNGTSHFTVGTFGFLFPHKNVETLVTAVAIAREYIPEIRLKLLTAVAAGDPSQLVRARVETLIEWLGLEDCVQTRFDFMDEKEVVEELHSCDLLAFVYGDSTETATGAARIALIADRPLLCSTSSVLADLHPVSHVVAATDPVTMAEALIASRANPQMLAMYDSERRKLAANFSYERLALRYAAHIESLLERDHG